MHDYDCPDYFIITLSIGNLSEFFPSGRIPNGHIANSRDVFATTSQPHMTIITNINKSRTSAHIEAGKTHNSSRNGGEKDEEHQSFFGVEIDDDKIRIFRIIIAGINGSGCVIPTISAVKVVKSHAFVFEGIDAPWKRKI